MFVTTQLTELGLLFRSSRTSPFGRRPETQSHRYHGGWSEYVGQTDMTKPTRKPIFLPPGGGRPYPMGRISSVFKADGTETESRCAISEWWLEPNTKGPGPHSHNDDDDFYVLEGTMSILIGDRWVDAPKGSFVLAPGGLTHDFENRTSKRVGILNISTPGGFEDNMPSIAKWFAEHPPGDALPSPSKRESAGHAKY